jgi:hypothetical protein
MGIVDKFKRAHGDLQGVVMSPNNIAVEWDGPGRILFSFAQRGEAISIHFSSDKKGLRHIKEAINDFCDWIFYVCEWCEMILAFIKNETKSVVRLVKKLGFFHVITIEEGIICGRVR